MKFDFRDGDPGWTGIDMTRERDALEPGMLGAWAKHAAPDTSGAAAIRHRDAWRL